VILNPDTQVLAYLLAAPESRIVAALVGFFLGVLCAGMLSRVMTS